MHNVPTTIKSNELVEKKREQIVKAAIKLFPKKGYHKATLRELAEESGISHGNIYDYVGSKEDIFLLVHETITGAADTGLKASIENIDDPLEKLQRMIHSEFELSHIWSDAILVMYQDLHVLSKPLLKKILTKESKHVALFESILDECVEKGVIIDCNTHVVANLVKIMIDSWVIKRWDLRDVSEYEMENQIYNFVFKGLTNKAASGQKKEFGISPLEGKRVIFINGGTLIGEALTLHLLSKGAIVGIYHYDPDFIRHMELKISSKDARGRVRFYSEKNRGEMNHELFRDIVSDFGKIDIFIQDLGISKIKKDTSNTKTHLPGEKLRININLAQNLSYLVQEEMTKRGSGKVLYIAPWAWDKYTDPILYETIKAEAIAITKALAKRMAQYATQVNCIIPGYIGEIKSLREQGQIIADMINRIPNEKLGEVQNVVEAASFLVSGVSNYLTGQILEVNGGMNFDNII